MATVTASEARRNLFPLIAKVNDDRDIVRITSKAGTGVLMAEADYDAWQTTLHLLSSPTNARRIDEALAEVSGGRVRWMSEAEADNLLAEH